MRQNRRIIALDACDRRLLETSVTNLFRDRASVCFVLPFDNLVSRILKSVPGTPVD
jgi:hypothetical protein